MKIININAMRGPNYWSVRRHKLIVMVLDLEEMEEKPSNKIKGFPERLKKQCFHQCILIDVQKVVKEVSLCVLMMELGWDTLLSI